MNMNPVSPESLVKWASILLNHSLGGIKPGMKVMIKGEAVGWPLIKELQKQIIQCGGIPDVNLVGPDNERGKVWGAAMGEFGTDEQIAAIPDWHRLRYESMDAYIEIMGTEDPSQFRQLTAGQAGRLNVADRPFRTIRLRKPWVLTLFPTECGAQTEGMTMADYIQFIVASSTSDAQAMKEAEEALAPLFNAAKMMTFKTRKPGRDDVLELRVGFGSNTKVELCYGERNWPDGELCRAPDHRNVNGEIYLDLPITCQGQKVRGTYLKFVDGRVVEFSAEEGQDVLQSIIETDEGSHRAGEVALGMNPGVDRVISEILFTEKVGGTAHIALGESLEDTFIDIEAAKADGSFNSSARHIDFVVDFRPSGAGVSVHLDDTLLVVKDGQWVVGSSNV